jgi:hypothetical protein
VKLFEIKAPDGRILRQHHAEKPVLTAGYEVTGIVFGAASDGTGGLVEKIGGPSLMAILIEAHGAELMAYLNPYVEGRIEMLRAELRAERR